MEIREIPIEKIVGSLCRMRLEFDYEKDELLASIRKYGVMNPIKVKAVKSGYLIFAGHRRRDCAAELGHKNIKAEVWEGIADREAAMIGFVDNINRKDFTPLEEGHSYKKMIEEYGYTVEEVVECCGKEMSRVYRLRNLIDNMTPEIEKAIIEGRLSAGAALVLLKFEDAALRKRLFQQLLKGKLSVRQLEYLLARQAPDAEKNERERLLDIVEDVYETDEEAKKLWDDSVRMHRSRRGDKIEIEFNGPMDLLAKYEVLSRPLKNASSRFKKIVGRGKMVP